MAIGIPSGWGSWNPEGGWSPPGGGNNSGTLAPVANPDSVYANMTKQDYLDYIKNFRPFEDELIEQAKTDTSLIDQAVEDTAIAQQMTADIAKRNLGRYGAELTPAERQQQTRNLQRANTLGGIQAISDARLAQKDANVKLLGDLINIGQGVNRSSLSQMGSAAADASARKSAYEQAKAASKQQTYSTIGGLGAAAILAFAL